MKLMMFEKGKGVALGLVEGKTVIDLGAADPSLPNGPESADRRRPERARRRQSRLPPRRRPPPSWRSMP